MLSSFTIKNFKSYREATLKLAPLTVLIGANASGKSNAIEGLRLLSWMAAGNRLSSFRYAWQDKDRAIRGKASELGFQGGRAFSLSCNSSHNPALLDALPDDAVPDVVFCYRDPADGSSRLIRLSDLPDYPGLIAQGSVGHLMTRGMIERFVKDHPGPEQKKQRAHAWLDELQKEVG